MSTIIDVEENGKFVAWRFGIKTGWMVMPNGCHIWQGSRDKGGYGKVRFRNRMQYIHRLRYELEVGTIPEGMHLDHRVCDNGSGGAAIPYIAPHLLPGITYCEVQTQQLKTLGRHTANWGIHCLGTTCAPATYAVALAGARYAKPKDYAAKRGRKEN